MRPSLPPTLIAWLALATTGVAAERPDRPLSFSNDIMPLLSKAGCNSGACHGAASGKKGFKLSLRGYDPAPDYLALTRGTLGRRIDLTNPDQSLLLLKATGQVQHEGGKRFDVTSIYAGLLRRWMAEGLKSDIDTAPKLTGLEQLPKFQTFTSPNQTLQLKVTARFSDGSSRDVTADTRFASSNENTAAPDEAGLLRMDRKGEAAITARYGSMIAVSHVVVLKRDPSFVWTPPPENNFIDKHVFAKLKAMETLPAELTTDEEFLRRVYYDVIGLPPNPDEIRRFLEDTRTDKRARVIDDLLERPEHAEVWAAKWAELLKLRFDLMRDKGTWGMYRWIRDSVAANKPFDKFVRELIAAEGSYADNPPANFYRVFNNPEEAAEATTQVFLGIRLLCAKCHDHPFEKWVQKDYYGMSAFFSQVNRKESGKREDQVVFRTDAAPQSRHPNTGETLKPKLLDAEVLALASDQDARSNLAQWMTRKDNPFLARATVNRLWSHLFGKGIIDPVDDIRSSNPPSNPELLDALTKEFLDRDFDVRHILRAILNSRTYQLSARTNRSNAEDTTNFSHAVPRRLTAEQLLDTLSQVTGIPENYAARHVGAGTVALPVGPVRAAQVPDSQLTAEVLELFGRPKGESTCACERHQEASMTQALHLINGKSVHRRLNDPNGRLAKLVATKDITDDRIIEDVYLLALGRLPKPAEREIFRKHFLEKTDKKLEAAQDLMWVLFNTKEFLFNH